MKWFQDKSIRKRLILLVLLNGVLIIISVFFINAAIEQQNYDAVLVNLAGRQRMLTQRMTKSVMILNSDLISDDERLSITELLRNSGTLYENTLNMFMTGGETDLNGQYVSTPPLTHHLEVLDQLHKEWELFKIEVYTIIEHSDLLFDDNLDGKTNSVWQEEIDTAILYIIRSNETLLKHTDEIVTLLQSDAEHHVKRVKVSMYLVLFMELLLILAFLKSINNGIIKPFERLFVAIETIGRGWPYTPTHKERYYEWLMTEEHILHMYQSLKNVQNDLFMLNQELEMKVKDRTANLEATIQQLEETYEKLLESEKQASLGVLIAGVAHEVNTTLGACITGSSQIILENEQLIKNLEDGKLSKEAFIDYVKINTELIELIDTNLRRAAEIIRSFKRVAVYQSANIVEAFYLDEYIDDLWISLGYLSKKYDVTFINELPHELIYGDPGDYSQVFTNLIVNTFVHGYDIGDAVKIVIQGKVKDKMLEISYKDYGKGILEKHIGKIFDPFYTTNRSGGGSGLGLNIVYQIIVNKLKGKISCQSEVGKYTMFKLQICRFREEGYQ